jgi:hypothetical protein
MKLSDLRPEAKINERTFRLISHTLVAAMMACVTLTIGNLVGQVMPDWPQWPIAILMFLIAIERLYTYERTKKISLFGSEWLFAFGAQWVVILLVLRLVIGLETGPGAFLAELPRWPGNLVEHFFSAHFLTGLMLTLLIWLLTRSFAELLDEMGLNQALIALDAGPENNVPPARERLVNLVFVLCTAQVFIAAILRLNLRALQAGALNSIFFDLPPLAGGGASTLLYFMLSLALLSLTQFMALHTRWSLGRVPVSENLAGRWALYSLVFLALLAALVSLLPTRYSLGLLTLLGLLVSLISYALQMLVMLFFIIISLPLALLGRKTPVQNQPIQPPTLPEALQAVESATPIPWFEILKAVVFWGGLLALIIFSIVQFLRQHQEILAVLRKMPGWGFFARLFQWFSGFLQGAQKELIQIIATGRERLRNRSLRRELLSGGFLNLRRLDPRQKVYFFYLAFIRRSGETGLPRRLSQTPTEFAAAVEKSLPAAEPDIDALTAAFIEARYSRQPVEPEKANFVRATWERLRKALRGNKAESGK